MLNIKAVKTIAKKEFLDSIRDSWILAVAGIFAIISIAISYFGMSSRGQTGLQNFEITITSLMSLVIYLIPLIALLLGYSAISGEREQGSLALLLSQPLTRGEVIVGKFSGLALALTSASLFGFGAAGLLIMWRVGSDGWLHYVYFLISSIALGLVFLSLGLLISVLSTKKASSAVGAIFLWFFLTFIYDLMLLGFLMVTSKKMNVGWLASLLVLNPGDVFRLANLLHLETLKVTMGLVHLVSPKFMNGGILTLIFIAWIVIPLMISVLVFREQDI